MLPFLIWEGLRDEIKALRQFGFWSWSGIGIELRGGICGGFNAPITCNNANIFFAGPR
jgi:hypothetical protein